MLYPSLDRDFIIRKYNIDKKCLNNIIVDDCYKHYIENVLFFDTHCFDTTKLNAKNIFVVANSEINFKPAGNQNIKIYSEFFHERNYTHKLYLDIQKIFKHENRTYINAMDTTNIEVLKIMNNYRPFILKNPSSAFQNYKYTNFRPDFFKEFNRYVYIKTPKTFDRHPRMFNECVYQGIECFYHNIGNEVDPSTHRFNDRFELEKRDIKNDEIISAMLSN